MPILFLAVKACPGTSTGTNPAGSTWSARCARAQRNAGLNIRELEGCAAFGKVRIDKKDLLQYCMLLLLLSTSAVADELLD